jgi:hypothetical protein
VPVNPGALVFVHLRIFYDDGPGTETGFTPLLNVSSDLKSKDEAAYQ